MKTLEELIEIIGSSIDRSISQGDDFDDRSWQYEVGILISRDEAASIFTYLRMLKEAKDKGYTKKWI